MRFVTTSHKAKSEDIAIAKETANLLSLPYIERGNRSADTLCQTYGEEYFLMIGAKGPVLCTAQNRQHKFHLSMGELRILELDRGKEDYLVTAIGGHANSILDCTSGLGADSLLMAYAFPAANVTGLEVIPELAYITNNGCRNFTHKNSAVTEALRRIHMAAISYEKFLSYSRDNSFDIVYFDPMFATPVKSSPQFLPLREITCETALTKHIFEEACRVASQKVIVKERTFSPIFETLGITKKIGGKYSRITYGVYDI